MTGSYWIQTYTGRKFVLTDPRPEDVCIEDIAHSLSLQCRFNGHCIDHYSVAEHSHRVSGIVPPEHALAGLLHDAAEAYIGDMVKPLKMMMPAFREVEREIMMAVCCAFEIAWPIAECVKKADCIMLATEARDLMAMPPDDWHLTEEPDRGLIIPVTPLRAEYNFLKAFEDLRGALCG